MKINVCGFIELIIFICWILSQETGKSLKCNYSSLNVYCKWNECFYLISKKVPVIPWNKKTFLSSYIGFFDMIYRILTPLPVLSIHARQGWNPVLNGNCKNVCLEGVTLMIIQHPLLKGDQFKPVCISPSVLFPREGRKWLLGQGGMSREPKLPLCVAQPRAKELPLPATSPWTRATDWNPTPVQLLFRTQSTTDLFKQITSAAWSCAND